MTYSPATISMFLMCVLAIVGCDDSRPNTSTAHDKGEIARGVAEDFLISTGPAISFDLLMSKAKPFATKEFANNVKSGVPGYRFKAWSINSQSMNSSQTEAIVRGSVQATRRWVGGTSFAVDDERIGFRIVLRNSQDKWLVDTIEFGATQFEEKSSTDGDGSQ